MLSDAVEHPVAIVGAGPVGLALALCLARHDLPSIIVERRVEPSTHPRAHVCNTRTMELFRRWGVADEVTAAAYPSDHRARGALSAFGVSADALDNRAALSPIRIASCAQDKVEAALRRAVSETGRCEIRWGCECVAIEQDGDAVRLTVDGAIGPDVITSHWLVAADGAASTVRRLLDIEMLGDPDLGSVVNVHFDADLSAGATPPLISLSKDPDVPASFVSMDGARRYCMHVRYDRAVETIDDYDMQRCESLVRRAAGVDDGVPIDVHGARPWTMTALVAETMRVGRIFLAGDAAHAFPPTGGFGMNSGIQDAHNLAWKLALVENDQAPLDLLDSYEAERQPIAFFNTAQSLRNAKRTSPQSALIEARASTAVRSVAALADTDEERQRLEVLEHFAAIGQDLGFAYDSSPIVIDDGTTRPDIHVSTYVPNAAPGSRAPHVPLSSPPGGSLLDELDGSFVVVTTPEGDAWSAAVSALASSGVVVRSVVVGDDVIADDPAGFLDVYGITPRGCVMVRPDGHVAFRSAEGSDDPAATLRWALAVATGHHAAD